MLYSTDSHEFKHGEYENYLDAAINPDTLRPIFIRAFWEEMIDYSHSKRLYLLFYDIDTIRKYKDMDYILKNEHYLYKRGYTKQELIDRNWIINFFH